MSIQSMPCKNCDGSFAGCLDKLRAGNVDRETIWTGAPPTGMKLLSGTTGMSIDPSHHFHSGIPLGDSSAEGYFGPKRTTSHHAFKSVQSKQGTIPVELDFVYRSIKPIQIYL
jgi:hypothetical protein